MKRIPLTQGKFALVDDADYEWLNQWKWYTSKGRNTFYAMRYITKPDGTREFIYMHREILGLKFGDKRQGDHRNHNGLDNQRINLRICNHQQNLYNMNSNKNTRSVFKGIYWHKQNHKWCAHIKAEGKSIYLGTYDSETEAAKAYDKAAHKYFGEYANLNLPEGQQICAS